ncbi:MAG TPA: hydrolase 1, exosortase A system-associated [Rubrivivax sp.]|nr:hydrolase 1, exosortase A system-associated [Rubrivivax sp.]
MTAAARSAQSLTPPSEPPPFDAFFLEAGGSGSGARFVVHHPAGGGTARAQAVFVHALGEEMNKSRRMAALQARALARAGCEVVQIDLAGCGDSAGDFSDATWTAWVKDVVLAADWMQTRWDRQQAQASASGAAGEASSRLVHPPLWLWGHRVGCLVAAEALRLLPGPASLLCWQPVTSGKVALQQFLRLRVAGEMLEGGAKGLMDRLKLDLAEGRAVDVAGYRLSPALASGLQAATLAPPATATTPARTVWLELSTQADATTTPAVAAAAERWRAAGWATECRLVQGPAFWQTTEIEDAPALVRVSVDAMLQLASPAVAGAPACAPASPEASTAAGTIAEGPPGTEVIEEPVPFHCAGESLLGILSMPRGKPAQADIAVLIIVGGPQYRAGSHRQFVQMARAAAAAGYPAMRFDCRGMGDSTGALQPFEAVSQDVAAAETALRTRLPNVERVVLWGLCDGASAALLYLQERGDEGIAGLCLLNPWARSASTLARTHVKHYYLQRLLQPAFWTKLLSGQVAGRALNDLRENLRLARQAPDKRAGSAAPALTYQDRMADAWRDYQGSILLVLSEIDYTAKEFVEHATSNARWKGCLDLPTVERADVAGADHTFSDLLTQQAVEQLTLKWLVTLTAGPAGPQPARPMPA